MSAANGQYQDTIRVPFEIDLSDPDGILQKEALTTFEVDEFDHLFPAVFRSSSSIKPATLTEEFMSAEFDLDRLEDPDVYKYLWFAGTRSTPKQLTVHKSVGTEIKPVELLDLHLVWGSGRILVKPIPRYILCPEFWAKHLICSTNDNCPCWQSESEKKRNSHRLVLGDPDIPC